MPVMNKQDSGEGEVTVAHGCLPEELPRRLSLSSVPFCYKQNMTGIACRPSPRVGAQRVHRSRCTVRKPDIAGRPVFLTPSNGRLQLDLAQLQDGSHDGAFHQTS